MSTLTAHAAAGSPSASTLRAQGAGRRTAPLRITHVITGLTIGGAQQLLLELCRETLACGHLVRVIGLSPGCLAEEFRAQGIQVDELALNGMVSPGTLLRLTALLKHHRPDIVHTHLGRADSYARVAAWLAGVPAIVTTVHNVEAWKEGFFLKWIDAATSCLADRLIACSERVAGHLREVGVVSMSKVSVIRNGIRVADWSQPPEAGAAAALRKEFATTSDQYVVGVVGRLEPQKGHRHLWEALAAVKAEIPGLCLWVIGEGSLRDSLERQATELNISSHIRFCGSRRDMQSVYAALDAVVMPSLWEGLPLALLEAMASRRPVIATSVGGIPEVITHEKNGLLCPPRDSQALAQALRRCHCEPDFVQNLTGAAFETVADNFAIEINVQEILATYQQMAGNWGLAWARAV